MSNQSDPKTPGICDILSDTKQTVVGSIPLDCIDLRELQLEQIEWRKKNFPKSVTHEPCLGVGEEVGEMASHLIEHFLEQGVSFLALAKSVGRLQHHQLKAEQGIRYTSDQIRKLLEDDAADIVIYLADFCTRHNIDLEGAVYRTWQKVRKRDWQSNKLDADKVAEAKADLTEHLNKQAAEIADKLMPLVKDGNKPVHIAHASFATNPTCLLCDFPIDKEHVYGISGVQSIGSFFHELCAKKVIQHAPTFNQPPAGIAHDQLKECPGCGTRMPITYTYCPTCSAPMP